MENQTKQSPWVHLAAAVMTMLGLWGFGFFFFLTESQSGYRYHVDIRPDSQGMWKTNIHTGESKYCSVHLNAARQPVEGQCIEVKNPSS